VEKAEDLPGQFQHVSDLMKKGKSSMDRVHQSVEQFKRRNPGGKPPMAN
jgi:hypothetical protein